jgi:hypothetical protein
MYLARVCGGADTVMERAGGGLRLRSPVLRHGGLAEPLRLENPTTIVPGDGVTHLVYDVCTG